MVLGKRMNYSFFVNGHRGAANIRGLQIATRLQGKLNPEQEYADDICIFVKNLPQVDVPVRTYIDIVDRIHIIPKLKRFPTVGIIALTDIAQNYISEKLKGRHIVVIPQHHCNFERRCRPQREIKTVGYIGSSSGLMCNPKILKKMFHKKGLSFLFRKNPSSRQQTTDFLNKIDINIAFRCRNNLNFLKDSIKIYNAGSFGIPTVAYPTPSYECEFKDHYLPVETIEDMVETCAELANNQSLYDDIAFKALEKSEAHHIDNIIPYYERLQNL